MFNNLMKVYFLRNLNLYFWILIDGNPDFIIALKNQCWGYDITLVTPTTK